MPCQYRFQCGVEYDAVNAGLRAAYPRVGRVLVVSDQSGDEDASGRRTQTVYAAIGDVDAGVVPAWRDLVGNAFVIRDQDPSGPNGERIPLESAYRKRRLDEWSSSSPIVLIAVPNDFPKELDWDSFAAEGASGRAASVAGVNAVAVASDGCPWA